MSTRASVVQLINSPIGKMSTLLYAQPFLTSTLHKHIELRKLRKYINIFPPISIISLTHFIPINNSFKPCIIMAFEYIRNTVVYTPGKSIEVELKQNCDYINDIYLEVTTPVVSCTPVTLPPIVVKPADGNVYAANASHSLNFGTGALNTAVQETSGNINVFNGFNYIMTAPSTPQASTPITSGSETYNILASTGAGNYGGISYIYTDIDGNFIAGPDGTNANPTLNGFGGAGTAVTYANNVKAADFIGFKFFHRNLFKIDDNPISDYTSQAMVNYRERLVTPLIRPALDRLIGQEVPSTQICEKLSVNGKYPSGFTVGSPQLDTSRQYIKAATNGLQTSQPSQPQTVLRIPCIHWFNIALAQALPVACMPDGQLRLQLDVSPLWHLFYPAPGIYIQETLYAVDSTAPGTIAHPNIYNSRRIPFTIPGSVVIATDDSNTCITVVAGQYLMDELVHTMIISRVGFNMILLFREETVVLKTEGRQNINLTQLKWPTDFLFINDQPYWNIDETNPDTAENWWRCGYQRKYDGSTYLHNIRKNTVAGTDIWTKENLQVSYLSVRHVDDVVTELGVNLYDTYYFEPHNHRIFYSDLLVYTFHNGLIHTSDDQHASLFVTFSYLPGMYQTAGFVNLSKSKELYFSLNVAADPNSVNGYIKVRLVTIARGRNFILIADGSAVLRYA